MPTKTFFNLPEEKRGRIFEAAVDEFSEVRFSEASINRIIKAAGISRGSFYQYFEDKEDLFKHVFTQIGREKIGVYEGSSDISAEVDLFANIFAAMPAIFDWADRNEKYNRIGLLLVTEQPEMLERMFPGNQNTQWFVDYIKERQRQGAIRMDIDPQFVVELLQAITMTLLQEYYIKGNREGVVHKVHSFFDIIAHGIALPPAQAREEPL